MKILAVCGGKAEKCPGRSYRTGINKTAIMGPVLVDAQGIVGDAICNRRHHGGVDQAIYVEGAATRRWWEGELGRPLEAGAFGENLLIEDVDNRAICVGDRFVSGAVILEVTSARIPCATFAAHMGDPKFVARYTQAGRPGIYCRVVAGGYLTAGDPVEHHPFGGARVTISEMMASDKHKLQAADRARYLSTPIHHKLRARLKDGG